VRAEAEEEFDLNIIERDRFQISPLTRQCSKYDISLFTEFDYYDQM